MSSSVCLRTKSRDTLPSALPPDTLRVRQESLRSSAARDFHKWRNAKEIVENYRILVYPRKGEGVSASMWENLFLIDAPLADVSSTEIREMLGEGQDISPYVPQPALPLILNYYSVK